MPYGVEHLSNGFAYPVQSEGHSADAGRRIMKGFVELVSLNMHMKKILDCVKGAF